MDKPDALHRYAQQIIDGHTADGPAENRRLLVVVVVVVVVVDQFEELFTAVRDEDDPRQAERQRRRQAFVDNLLTATEAAGPTIVVFTLRADFYAQVTQFDNLRRALGDLGGSRQKYIGPMSEAELHRAIE